MNTFKSYSLTFNNFLIEHFGMNDQVSHIIILALSAFVIILIAYISRYIAKNFFLNTLRIFVKHSKTEIDDVLLNSKLPERIARLIPAIVINALTPIFFYNSSTLIALITTGVNIYIIIITLSIIDAILNSVVLFFQRSNISKRFAINGFVQAIKIIVNIFGFIYIISICFNKSPTLIFSSLGALTAILMLIFKDTILGFVAGLQIMFNNMIAKGDWIEMPKYGADGDVMEITLTTIKVQNWDKTITFIPAYAMISDSFKNWKGMSLSGGRRIKRSLDIDMQTVSFLSNEQIKRFKDFALLNTYMNERETEINTFNKENNIDEKELLNGRRMTNIGCFRAYCIAYLKNHPKIHKEMTFLIRQLAPTDHGLPLEIYVFTNDIVWANYEAIQADIFDHLLSVIHSFDLKVFQRPSGNDFQKLT